MDQLSIFDITMPTYKVDKKVRLIELFAGVGSQAMALERLGVDFETYKVVEFDQHAINSYNAIHGTNFTTIDITQISADDLEITDTDKFEYIMTYSFPCQDLSVAGKQKGMARGGAREVVYFGKLKDCSKNAKNYLKFCLWKMYPKLLVMTT